MELRIEELKKSFGEKEVLRGFSFTAKSGEAFGLLGRNGAGKTTTIRILMGVFPADSGRVLVDGEPIDYDRIGIGYLPEERGLYPKKKIIDQLTYFAMLKGMSKADAIKSIDKWLERLEMTEYRNKKLETLSKGNQQKIQLITALAHDPDIVILDEPFSGLDPVNARLLKDVVREEIALGKIVLFSSHQMGYIEEFCDSICILNGGNAVLSGNLAEIKRGEQRDRLIVKAVNAAEIAEKLGGRVGEKGDAILRFKTPEERRALTEKLAAFEPDSISVYEPSLNDIFVKYVKEDAENEKV